MPSSQSDSSRSSKRRRKQTSANSEWSSARPQYPQSHTRKEPNKYNLAAQPPCPGGLPTCPEFAHTHGPEPQTNSRKYHVHVRSNLSLKLTCNVGRKHCHFVPTAKILDMEFGANDPDVSNTSTQAVFQGAAPYRGECRRVRSKDPEHWFQDREDSHVPHDECWSHTGHQGSDITDSSMNDVMPYTYRKTGTTSPGGWYPITPAHDHAPRPPTKPSARSERSRCPKGSPLIPGVVKEEYAHNIFPDSTSAKRSSAAQAAEPYPSDFANASRHSSRRHSTVRSKSSDGDLSSYQFSRSPSNASNGSNETLKARSHQSNSDHAQGPGSSNSHHSHRSGPQHYTHHNYMDYNAYPSQRFYYDHESHAPFRSAERGQKSQHPHKGDYPTRSPEHSERAYSRSAPDAGLYPPHFPLPRHYTNENDYNLYEDAYLSRRYHDGHRGAHRPQRSVRSGVQSTYLDGEGYHTHSHDRERRRSSNSYWTHRDPRESHHYPPPRDYYIPREMRHRENRYPEDLATYQEGRPQRRDSTSSRTSASSKSSRSSRSSSKKERVSRVERFSKWIDDLLGAVFLDHTFGASRPSSRASSTRSGGSRRSQTFDEDHEDQPRSPASAYESHRRRSRRG